MNLKILQSEFEKDIALSPLLSPLYLKKYSKQCQSYLGNTFHAKQRNEIQKERSKYLSSHPNQKTEFIYRQICLFFESKSSSCKFLAQFLHKVLSLIIFWFSISILFRVYQLLINSDFKESSTATWGELNGSLWITFFDTRSYHARNVPVASSAGFVDLSLIHI
eukprot:TRINITY_DN1994_c0_g1_i3.p1 TRINITY_DN1994_c0_g1~~TRINITY_DN1994_c0_g1_i3.p1  ORF type:complete len:164 (+),score=2.78 TRINITY_DN1994_c0_g1_i3:39-530(+)